MFVQPVLSETSVAVGKGNLLWKSQEEQEGSLDRETDQLVLFALDEALAVAFLWQSARDGAGLIL